MQRKKKIEFVNIDYFENDSCREIYEQCQENQSIPESTMKACSLSELKWYLAGESGEGVFDLIPEHIKLDMYNREFITVCMVTPENEVAGIGMLARSLVYDAAANLEFLYISDPFRTQEFLNEMTYRCMAAAVARNIRYLYIRNIFNLEQQDFVAPDITNREHLMGFKLDTVKRYFRPRDTRGTRTVDNAFAAFPYEADRLHENEGLIFFSEFYDMDFQIFSGFGRRLNGTLCARRITEDELAVFDYWVSEGQRDGKLLGNLFAHLLEQVDELMGEDARILIRAENEEQLEVYREILGKEDSYLCYTEELYCLDNHMELLEGRTVEPELPEDVSVVQSFIGKMKSIKEEKLLDIHLAVKDAMLLDAVPGLCSKAISSSV